MAEDPDLSEGGVDEESADKRPDVSVGEAPFMVPARAYDLQYQWRLISRPLNSEATLSLTESVTPILHPDFFCVGERTVTLTGQDFFEVAGALPTVLFGELELRAVAARGCVQVDQSDIRACAELDVTVPAGLNADLYTVSVRNPYPLACSDEGTKPTVLLISAPRVEQSAPSPLCRGQFSGEITLTGSGFLSEEGGGASSSRGWAYPTLWATACIAAPHPTCSLVKRPLPLPPLRDRWCSARCGER